MNTTEDKPAPRSLDSARVLTIRLVYSGDTVLTPPTAFAPGSGAMPIGREAAEGIALPRDRRASRLHATLHTGALGTLQLVDEGSRNGTLVNGQRIDKRERLLRDGDLITIGDSYLVVRAELPARFQAIGESDAALGGLAGVSPALRTLRSRIRSLASTSDPVLFTGERGAGHELAARALHDERRTAGPFTNIACGALSEELLAVHLKRDAGGTLHFDELAELSAAAQAVLVRHLEERSASAICLSAGTQQDSSRLPRELHGRFARHELQLPPLRARREDILLQLCAELGSPPPRLSSQLVEALLHHDWPLNLHELHTIAQALRAAAKKAELLELDLVAELLSGARGALQVESAKPLPAAPAKLLAEQPQLSLVQEGEVWRLCTASKVLRLKDSKGLRYLEHLLRHPEQEFHVLQLIAVAEPAAAGESLDEGERRAGGLRVSDGGDAGEVLDQQAQTAYRRRLEDLRDGLEEATQFGDRGRASRLRAEIEALTEQLAQAVGLAGRSRRSGALAERARINIQRRLRDAIDRIAEQDASIGRYLTAAIRTGSYCCYEPPGAMP